jgi:hypothetical protein
MSIYFSRLGSEILNFLEISYTYSSLFSGKTRIEEPGVILIAIGGFIIISTTLLGYSQIIYDATITASNS